MSRLQIYIGPIISGALFSLGLMISGMSSWQKVIGFLYVADGTWDPSLALVMASGTLVMFIAYYFQKKMNRPLCAELFDLPTAKQLDRYLIVGAILFGIGWGGLGICPGPSIVSLSAFDLQYLMVFLGLGCGLYIGEKLKSK